MQGLAEFTDRYVYCPVCLGPLTAKSSDPPIQTSTCPTCYQTGRIRRKDWTNVAVTVGEWPSGDVVSRKTKLFDSVLRHNPAALAIGLDSQSPTFILIAWAGVITTWVVTHPSVIKILPDSALKDEAFDAMFETGQEEKTHEHE